MGTVEYDAVQRGSAGVYQALGLMNEAKHARRAVLVISNADQAASKMVSATS